MFTRHAIRTKPMGPAVVLVACLLLALIPAAQADALVFKWDKPATNADGSTPANVHGYYLYTGRTAAELLANKAAGKPLVEINNPDTLTHLLTVNDTGPHFFALDAWGCEPMPCDESELSPIVVHEVKPLLATSKTAMSVVPDYAKLGFVPSKVVGTVPLGTICDDKRMIADGYAGVPLAFVTWSVSPSARPANVVARCAR